VRISSKIDYGFRALAELAVRGEQGPCRAEDVANAQGIPLTFLLGILAELKKAHLVRSHRGRVGGYSLSRPPEEMTLADVARALEGPLVSVHDQSLRTLRYEGSAEALSDVWMALRTSMRDVLENVTVADLAKGALPAEIRKMARRYRDEEKKRARGRPSTR
jgi:Rrf2 family protein